MIEIKRFVCNMLQENCYVVSDETRECVIVDCGAFHEEEREAIAAYIRQNGLAPKHLLGTHGHLDHHFGDAFIHETFGLRPEVAAEDGSLMQHLDLQAQTFYGLQLDEEFPAVGHFFEKNEAVGFGNHTLTVVETPGHSRGSVCFHCAEDGLLLTGDTLFRRSIGRTDLKTGSMMQIIQSLRQLAQLPDDTRVLPGHGEATTIGEELAHNPFLER